MHLATKLGDLRRRKRTLIIKSMQRLSLLAIAVAAAVGMARSHADGQEYGSVLAVYAVPVRPMLGCVGVAPPGGQVIDARESGVYGGNMDFNEIREGVTLYLPVFQRGALLFLGDGHALQGDGELTGDALETSMTIDFSVEVFPSNSTFRRRINSPRAENDEYLMAIGISGDLSDALRAATTDLARWLATDYGLTDAEVASVLGSSMRYDVAELVGSEVSIVAKIQKIVSRQLRRATGPSGTASRVTPPTPPNEL